MVIFNRYKIVTAGFEKASKKLIHTGLREIGSFTCLSAELTGQKWSVNGQKATNQRFVAFFMYARHEY